MLQNEKIGEHLGKHRCPCFGLTQLHVAFLGRWQQGNGFVALQSQCREGFQMLKPASHMALLSLRQHRLMGAQRSHRVGNVDLCQE